MTTCTHNGTANGTCPICRFEPFVRNHYFDGKFMVARDFTDEQRYYVDKQRHHNARLHGWGVVCGLKVKPHENPACRSKYICIEPGTAMDCCGREIVISEEDCIDITQLAGWKALKKLVESEPEPKLKRLEICLKYRECPTEDVPVLYDECGCDETKCAPNRILESYDVDLRVVSITETQEFHDPKVEWHCSAGPSRAFRVALHSASNRLYAISTDKKAVLALDTTNHTVVGVYALNQVPTDLAVANDGKHLYVVIKKGESETDPHQLIVWDTQTGTQVSIDAIPGSVGDTVELAVAPAPDNRLCALLEKKGDVLIWPLSLETAATQPSPLSSPPNWTSEIHGLTFNKNAQMAYAAKPSDQTVRVLKLVPTQPPTPGAHIDLSSLAYAPSDLAFVVSTGTDALVAISKTTQRLLHVNLPGPQPNQFTTSNSLAHPATDLVVAPGGRWAYVLVQDTSGESYVQAVNLDRVQLQLTPNVSPPFKVGRGSRQLVLDASGSRLYIPFEGDPKKESSGGIAVLKVMEGSCEEIPWRSLEGCPQCETPDCIVIATIKDYKIGEAIEVGQIDNRTRHLLPSTQTLYEMIKCLKEHGGNGRNGIDGVNGKDGVGLEAGLTRIIDTSWKHNSKGVMKDARQLLGLPPLVTQIGGFALVKFRQNYHPRVPVFQFVGNDRENHIGTLGIVIAFSEMVKVYEADWNDPTKEPSVLIDSRHVFEVKARMPSPTPLWQMIPMLQLSGRVIPVKWAPAGAPDKVDWSSVEETGESMSKGIAMIFPFDSTPQPNLESNAQARNGLVGMLQLADELWITLRGDFVIDVKDKAIDAEFVRAEFPTGNRPDKVKASPPTDLGLQGGLFESWFWVMARDQKPSPVNVNDIIRARSALSFIPGTTESLVNRITEAQREKAFQSVRDFRQRANITPEEWNMIRDRIVVKKPEE